MTILLALSQAAIASVDPDCADVEKPDHYDEVVQQDFLNNYYSLVTTFSPLHAPVPHEGGHGAIGVDFNIVPPLGCAKRFAMDHTKTEDTNKTPVIPRPRLTFALDAPGPVVIYGGLGWVPPVKVFGTRNVILSTEVGVGVELADRIQFGGRFHATMLKTVANVATAFNEGDPEYDDLYLGSTIGFDAMGGYRIGPVVPYLAIGYTDVSTFFYIADDGIVANNYHPYSGLAFSLGVDGKVAKFVRFGAEFYGAPGGYSLPDKSIESVAKGSRYGKLYTGRVRLAVEL